MFLPSMRSLLIFSVAAVFLVYFTLRAEDEEEPVIEVHSIKSCTIVNGTPETTITFDGDISEGPPRSFSGKITLPFDVDDSVEYTVSLNVFEDGEWNELGLFLSGVVCKDLPVYLDEMWKKLTKSAGIKPDCPIKSGTYTLDNFVAKSTDVQLPYVVPGKFRVNTVCHKDGEEVLCSVTELTIRE